MPHEKFIHRLRVRYHEVDPQGVVFNSRYVEWIDDAMTEWVRSLGWDYPDFVASGCDPSVVSLKIDLLHPSRVDELVQMSVAPVRLGRSSFTLQMAIRGSGESHDRVMAEIVYVNVNGITGQAIPLPDPVRRKVESVLQPEAISHEVVGTGTAGAITGRP
jgi:acyl-CoA thioester hydrolase